MKIGFIGLGKLGLPVALAIESKGHQVIGTDINDTTLRNIRFKTLNYMEKGAEELLAKSNIQIKNIDKIVQLFVQRSRHLHRINLSQHLKNRQL